MFERGVRAAARQDWRTASSHFEVSTHLLLRDGCLDEAHISSMNWGVVCSELEDYPAARRLLEDAARYFENNHMTHEEGEARANLAIVHEDCGDSALAEHEHLAGLSALERAGMEQQLALGRLNYAGFLERQQRCREAHTFYHLSTATLTYCQVDDAAAAAAAGMERTREFGHP